MGEVYGGQRYNQWEDREQLISIEQLIDEMRYKEAAMAIERKLMDGERIASSILMRLPRHVRQLSPIIMHTIGMEHWREGRLLQAKEYMGLAVKGFASLYMPQSLLISFARLGQLELRTGEAAAAQIIIEQLLAEYVQTEQLSLEARAEIALLLGINGKLLSASQINNKQGQKQHLMQASKYLRAAIQAYEQLGQWEEACIASMELLLTLGEPRDSKDWNHLHNQCLTWSMRGAELIPYTRMLELLIAYSSEQWEEVLTLYSGLESSFANIPYWLSAAITAKALQASCQLHIRHEGLTDALEHWSMQRYVELLQAYIDNYRNDYMLLYELVHSLVECYRRINKADEQLEQRLQSLASMLTPYEPSQRTAVHETKGKSDLLTTAPLNDQGWKLYLFGGLRFAKGQKERRQLSWKRRKARELLIYLALQPRYTAVREQIIDSLQLGEPIDKANQQLYVIVHQLKRTLLDELGIEQGIIVKDGLIRLHEEVIEYVDVEHYLALIRVADQLWQFDRGISYEMYEQAYLLFDVLLPELPYVEWLEQHREFIMQKQISLLQKCLLHAEERQDWEHAEIYLRSWLTLRPFQEEAYARLINLLISLERLSEAKEIYAGWEKSCREELGTTPSFTPYFQAAEER